MKKLVFIAFLVALSSNSSAVGRSVEVAIRDATTPVYSRLYKLEQENKELKARLEQLEMAACPTSKILCPTVTFTGSGFKKEK